MSTDSIQNPIMLSPSPARYIAIQHHSPRRKPFSGSIQIIRHPEGFKLPHTLSPAVRRAMRSKYQPR